MREYTSIMPRATTTSDVFNAIAEPRRRQIVNYLASGAETDVTDLVLHLGLPQPAVSKHLGVLRKVGVVVVTKAGQRRLYRLNPQELKPVHDWIQHFAQLWTGISTPSGKPPNSRPGSLPRAIVRHSVLKRITNPRNPHSKETNHDRRRKQNRVSNLQRRQRNADRRSAGDRV